MILASMRGWSAARASGVLLEAALGALAAPRIEMIALLGGGVHPNSAGVLPCPKQAINGRLCVFPEHQPLGDHVFDRVLDFRGIHGKRRIALFDRKTGSPDAKRSAFVFGNAIICPAPSQPSLACAPPRSDHPV